MDPNDLPHLLDPVVEGRTDYSKGNRLFTGKAWRIIPKTRYLGNAVLSFLTKIASGYWHIADSQSGYRAVTLEVLKTLDLDSIYKRYGYLNDLLVKLNVYQFRVGLCPLIPFTGWGNVPASRFTRSSSPSPSCFSSSFFGGSKKNMLSGTSIRSCSFTS